MHNRLTVLGAIGLTLLCGRVHAQTNANQIADSTTAPSGAISLQPTSAPANPEFALKVQAGDKAASAGNWADAEADYAAAIVIDPNDDSLWIKRGDVLSYLIETDPNRIGQDRAAWQRALEINPRSGPALEKLLNSYDMETRFHESSQVLEKERDAAQRLHALQPNDVHATTKSYLVTVQAWLVGVQIDGATIDDALKNLQAISAADPTQSDPPYIIARARVRQGSVAAAQNDQAKAAASFAAADKVMSDAEKAVDDLLAKTDAASRPSLTNSAADIHWRAAQVDAVLSRSPGIDPTAKNAYLQRAHDQIVRAVDLVTSDDTSLVDIYLAARDIDMEMPATPDRDYRAEAVKILRALYALRPKDQMVRIELARLLSANPPSLQEAIDILELPQDPNEGQTGQLIQFARELKLRSTATLATLQMTKWDTTTDPAEKQQLLAQAQTEYTTVQQAWGDNLETLKLKGQIALAQGHPIDTIQALNRALTTIPGATEDDELMEFLGRAYEATRQDTQAQQCYGNVLNHHPDFYPALMRLTRLLVTHLDLTLADKYLNQLEHLYPTDLDVMILRIAYLDADGRDKNQAAIDRNFKLIPETTDPERIQKIQIAGGLGKMDDMARLLKDVITNEPKNVAVVMTLSRLYAQAGKTSLNRQLLADALKNNPDNPSLRIMSAQINGATTQQLLDLQREIYGQNPDAFTRDLQLANLNEQAGDLADAELELKDAKTIHPDDTRVIDALFNIYLSQGKFDQAAAFIPQLAAANQDLAHGVLYQFRLAMAKKDYDTALKMADQLVQDLPELAGSWLSKGQAEQALGRFENAMGDYTQARMRQSDNPLALSGLIDCDYALHNNAGALDYIKEAAKNYPNDPHWLQMEVQHFQKIATSPNDPAVRPQLIQANLDLANFYLNQSKAQTEGSQLRIIPQVPSNAQLALAQAKTLLAQAATDHQPIDPNLQSQFDKVQKAVDQLSNPTPAATAP